MDAGTRCHRIIVGLLLFCLAIEALTVIVLAVPLGMFGLNHCLIALIR